MKTSAVLIVDDPGGGGICLFFFVPIAGHLKALMPPPPGICYPRGKKSANPRGLARGGGGGEDGLSCN